MNESFRSNHSCRPWMVYGTGVFAHHLIACAKDRNIPIVIGGRNGDAVRFFSHQFGVAGYVFSLDKTSGHLPCVVAGVVNTAGPFSATAKPLMQWCIQAGADYIDLSNECSTYRDAWNMSESANQANMAIIPGTGWGTLAAETAAWCALNSIDDDPVSLTVVWAQDKGSQKKTKGMQASTQRIVAQQAFRHRDGEFVPIRGTSGIRRFSIEGRSHTIIPITTGDLYALGKTVPVPCIEMCGETHWPVAVARMVVPIMRLRARVAIRREEKRVVSEAGAAEAGARAKRTTKAGEASPLEYEKFSSYDSDQSSSMVWASLQGRKGKVSTGTVSSHSSTVFTVEALLGVMKVLTDRKKGERNGNSALRGTFTPYQLLGNDVVSQFPGVKIEASETI